jgi:uncharacterized membrane protein YdbT with pleckstrin-like domain
VVKKFETEEEVIKAYPSLKPAILFIILGLLMLILLFPLISRADGSPVGWGIYAIGILVFFYGLAEFIRRRRTRYYATNKRIVREYRSPTSLNSKEVPLNMVRAVTVKRGLIGSIFKVGDVVVSSGRGRLMNVKFKSIENAEEMANRIRELIAA